jgi:hypothetical protein
LVDADEIGIRDIDRKCPGVVGVSTTIEADNRAARSRRDVVAKFVRRGAARSSQIEVRGIVDRRVVQEVDATGMVVGVKADSSAMHVPGALMKSKPSSLFA